MSVINRTLLTALAFGITLLVLFFLLAWAIVFWQFLATGAPSVSAVSGNLGTGILIVLFALPVSLFGSIIFTVHFWSWAKRRNGVRA
jgi:hypothetical protein